MSLESRYANLEKFELIKIFYFLFSAAVVARIVCDINLNRVGIHLGEVYPLRKISPSTLPYSIGWLYFEWILAFLGAILINLQKIRIGALLITVSYLMSLSQMFQNQKVLMLIVAASLIILPLCRKDFWSIWFLRYQLIIIYFVSTLQKFFAHFEDGQAISSTLGYLLLIEKNPILKKLLQFFSQPLSINFISNATLVFEILIPFALIKKPKIGILLVFLFHFSLNLLMKDLLPFSLTMLALSFLFLVKPE